MVDWFSSIFSFLFLQAKLLMLYLRLIPTLLFVFALTGCGSDEIEVSEEQSAAQKKVEELGGNWTGRGAISIDLVPREWLWKARLFPMLISPY